MILRAASNTLSYRGRPKQLQFCFCVIFKFQLENINNHVYIRFYYSNYLGYMVLFQSQQSTDKLPVNMAFI